LKIEKVDYDSVIASPDHRLDARYHKAYDDCIDYVGSFIDSRPLSRSDNSMLFSFTNLNELQLFLDRGNYNGYCEWTGEGRIAINDANLPLKTTFEPTFEKSSSFRTLAHEMMHWLDSRDPSLRKRISDFYERRTAGDSWEPSPYGGEYKKDKWQDQYMGQRYKAYEDRGFGLGMEVPTRGIELLLSDPLKFAEDDFEHFSFMVTEVLGTGQ